MPNPTDSSSWHWAESDHWEVAFHGLPNRFPWPNDQPSPPQRKSGGSISDFPIIKIYNAIEAMIAEQPDAAHDPRFTGFMRQIEAGDSFIPVMERNDFIAAEGILRDAERQSHETPYLLFNKAFVLRQTDRKEEAADCYRRATELYADAEVVWMCYAQTCEELGRRAEAIRAYHEARRILPNHQESILALERLGELFRVSRHESPDEMLWLTKAELRPQFETDLQKQWDNPDMLRGFGGKVLHDNLFPDLALRALQRAVELDPTHAEGQRNLGAALIVNRRPAEAFGPLRAALALDPNNPWLFFHLAQAHVLAGQLEDALQAADEGLEIDPNHKALLQLRYLSPANWTPEQKEFAITEFSKARGSWQGYLLAANHAWKRQARERAVKFAAEAYKLEPQNEEVFLTYTGMLGESGEHEWVAALTKPRLRTDETNPRAWLNFARALVSLGLRAEAIATLQRALAELKLDSHGQYALQGELDKLTERWAASEAELEFHNGANALRRPIFQIRDEKCGVRLFNHGMSTGSRREIQINLSKPRGEFDFTVGQAHEIKGDDPEIHPLGTFTISELDAARLVEEPVKLMFTIGKQRELVMGAKQGERKLRVTWSLYPPPRHEATV
jgi:tetratricopeptide (TPR) repeat protein